LTRGQRGLRVQRIRRGRNIFELSCALLVLEFVFDVVAALACVPGEGHRSIRLNDVILKIHLLGLLSHRQLITQIIREGEGSIPFAVFGGNFHNDVFPIL
jgi:hypothetical protein